MARILVLEDDPGMAEWLEDLILTELHDFQPEVELLETESDFVLEWLVDFEKGRKAQPHVIVIDVMLRWTDPAPNQPPRPQTVIEGGFTRAGIRCANSIRRHDVLARSHVILFTSLSKQDLDSLGVDLDGITFVNKDDGQAVLEPIRTGIKSVTLP